MQQQSNLELLELGRAVLGHALCFEATLEFSSSVQGVECQERPEKTCAFEINTSKMIIKEIQIL